MKKCIWLIVILAIFGAFFSIVLIYPRPRISFDKNIMLDNKDAYTEIAQLCYKDFQKNTTDTEATYIIDENDEIIRLSTNVTDTVPIQLDIVQSEYSDRIKETFELDDHCVSSIFVHDGFVSFGIANGRASFIYSTSDKKPDFVNSPNEDFDDIYVEKITDNWYYACRQD